MKTFALLAILFLAAALAPAQTNFFWTNTTSATWSAAGWTNETGSGGPVSGGSNNYTITFQPDATYNATLNLGAPLFTLNQLVFNAGTVRLLAGSGTSLVFRANSAGGLPLFLQNSASNITIGASVVLSNDTTFAGTGAGMVTISNVMTGAGTLIKTNDWTLRLTATHC
jgi:hypothetical protein